MLYPDVHGFRIGPKTPLPPIRESSNPNACPPLYLRFQEPYRSPNSHAVHSDTCSPIVLRFLVHVDACGTIELALLVHRAINGRISRLGLEQRVRIGQLGPIWLTENGNVLTYDRVLRTLKKLCFAANVPVLPHMAFADLTGVLPPPFCLPTQSNE